MSYHRNLAIDWMSERCDDYTDPKLLAGDAALVFGLHPEVALTYNLVGIAAQMINPRS